MSKNFIYVNADGYNEESIGAYETTDYVSSSAGAGDAGKPIVLDAGGLIDASMIDDSDIDHGSIGGLTDDDHTQYLLADGTRVLTGDWVVDGTGTYTIQVAKAPVGSTDVVNKAYADAVAAGFGPKRSVRVATTTALTVTYDNGTGGVGATLTNADTQSALVLDGITMVVGDRVLVKDQASTLQNGIYTVTNIGSGSTNWVLTRATDCDNSPDGEVRPGDYTFVEEGTISEGYGYTQVDFDTGDAVGTDPITYTLFLSPQAYSAGDGIDIASNVISVDVTDIIDTSAGLTETSNDIQVNLEADGAISFDGVNGGLEVNVDGTTIEITTNALQVKADGINDTHIDWGTGANQVSAVDIPIEDSAGNFTAIDVENALSELYDSLDNSQGIDYTVGTGGVTAGDLVYISANDTVVTYSNISTAQLVIGVAATTESAAGTVKVLANDTVMAGILSGATAGTRYYWTGSGYSTNLAGFSSGEYIYAGGVAKNATDVHVEVTFLKKAV